MNLYPGSYFERERLASRRRARRLSQLNSILIAFAAGAAAALLVFG